MATLPDDALRKVVSITCIRKLQADHTLQILIQIQQTAIQSQRALNISRQQTAAKERERRILQLTIEEIKALDEDVNLYKGVGKMYGSCYICKARVSLVCTVRRFLQVPRPTMEKDLKNEEKEITDDINSLTKKVRVLYVVNETIAYSPRHQSKYLEKQFNDAQGQLRDIVRFSAGS